MGILGGGIIAYTEFSMPVGFYINKVFSTIGLMDLTGLMIKCAFFALVISLLAGYLGLITTDGTRELVMPPFG